MHPRFKIIVNPITNKAKEKACVVDEVFKKNDLLHDIYFTRAPQDAEVMTKKFVGEGWTNFVVIGGDGTVSEVINGAYQNQGVVDNNFCIGIIPAGTANDHARSLGIPLDATKACQKIVKGEFRKVDLIQAEYDGVGRLMHVDGGLGLTSEALSSLESKKTEGPWAYIMLALKTISRHRNEMVHYVVDGNEMDVNTTVLIISCGGYFLGFKDFRSDARLDDGRFEVTILHDMSWYEIIGALLDLIRGNLSKNPKVIFLQPKEALVSSENALQLNIDGELKGSLPVRFSVKPGALKIFA